MAKKVKKFKESIGIDIGSHSIKLVHLKKIHNGHKLLNCDIRSTVPEGVEYTPNDLRKDRFAPILASMLKNLKINPKSVKRLVTAVGGDNVSIKQIKTIFLPEDELESALFFEAKKHLPIGGSEMMLDFHVLEIDEKTNNMSTLLVASTKTLINEHSLTLTNAGLNPGVIDAEPLGVANAFALSTFVEDGIYVILNVGAHKTNMIIYGPKTKFFTRDIQWGGYHITKDIMKKKKLGFEEAEKWKFEHGIKKDGSENKGNSLLALDISDKSTEEQIALEVKRSLRYYVKEAGNSDFRKILLVGGGGKTVGLPEYINSQLNIDCELFDAFTNVEVPEENKDPQLALALGLALRPE